LEDLTEREDNHFTEEHALAAIEAYYDPIIHKLTRDRIERRTAIELPKNKRNGRPQKQHVEVMNAVREIDHPNGSWRNKDGAPTKADLVREYAAAHPDASHSAIARELGISRTTVIKWLHDAPEEVAETERPNGSCDSAMVEFRDAIRTCFEFAAVDGTLVLPIERAPSEREKRERETVKSSGTTGKIPDGSREPFPIDDRLTNGHN
ncbi:helix-turn-helix domain-containing protein, partial [Collinsella aerofaciens]|uniref:helix-turn-helix domain-containing protein n=5 Tax=Collinsella aerofaciens TaxID=74426 RepID=UPI00325C071C